MSDKKYDLRQLEELAGGNTDFVDSMVETFLEHTPIQLNEMLDAHKNQQLNVLGAIAHKIKPNIDLFEIVEIKDDVRLLEEYGKNNMNSPEVAEALGRLERVLKEVFKQLEQR
jgi:HPt (histidine-containing phosphotransfer) domain-containing protein